MARLNWTPRVKLDNQIVITAFMDSASEDYSDINQKAVTTGKPHPTFNVMYEKYYQSYLIGNGTINYILTWTPEYDADMNYYLNNIKDVPHIFPTEIMKTSVDLENRTIMYNFDNTRYIKNKWYNHNQWYAPGFPTRFETAEDHTSVMCILHDPTYKWSFNNVVLEQDHSIEFSKSNLDTDYYIFCMNNSVDTSNGKTLNTNTGYKLLSNSITLSATHGEASIAIIEKTVAVET